MQVGKVCERSAKHILILGGGYFRFLCRRISLRRRSWRRILSISHLQLGWLASHLSGSNSSNSVLVTGSPWRFA